MRARLTADDLLRLPDNEARRELVGGEVREMPLANPVHGRTAARFATLLSNHAVTHSLGEVVVEAGFLLRLPHDPEQVRGPDVAFISQARVPAGGLPSKGFFDGPPDLAVEIISPSDEALKLSAKINDYLQAGTRLIWVVDPVARTITVYRPDGTARILRGDQALEGENVLPSLRIPLDAVLA